MELIKGSEREVFDGRYDPIMTAYMILRYRGRYLLAYNSNRKLWELPGGIIGKNESPRDCAVRECMEKSGQLIYRPEFVGLVRLEQTAGTHGTEAADHYSALYFSAVEQVYSFAGNDESGGMKWIMPDDRPPDACRTNLMMIRLATERKNGPW